MENYFITEQEMTKVFLGCRDLYDGLKYPNWKIQQELEVEGLFGIPDVVIAFGKLSSNKTKIIRLCAFELKLKNWKRALIQAYKYASFAHYSYVVMDESNIKPAIHNLHLFENSNIGLLGLDTNQQITWYNTPNFQQPYSYQLFQRYYFNLEKKFFNYPNLSSNNYRQ